MELDYAGRIAQETGLKPNQVAAALKLFGEGATIPFIARYRKEMTGSMDEVDLARVRDIHATLKEFEERKAFILKTIDEQGNLSPELEKRINSANSLNELEDIYLPYKPKRRTKATVAREKGLEPLAKQIMAQNNIPLEKVAARFVDKEKEVSGTEDALQGARDIIAEWVSESPRARGRLRNLYEKRSTLSTRVVKGKEKEGQKFRDYFSYSERFDRAPSHRILAMRRAENEGIIRMKIEPEEGEALNILRNIFIKSDNDSGEQVWNAVKDSYKRLLSSSLENEMRAEAKKKADEEAIRVFAENLRQLLMSAPLGRKRVLAIDPGFRTGCKVVCLDAQGNLLHHDVIYPHPPSGSPNRSRIKLQGLLEDFEIAAIAIGNGTAGRETEAFVKKAGLDKDRTLVMVNESGASIYSASEVAREEFPDLDLTVRGAVSIGRRLMDPLAELVKIDPKSIGVGQYQHDVDQGKLKEGLDLVVESCVNNVGVELNTASKELLTYVSGLGPSLAENIIKYREQKGAFSNREQLKEVSRLGDKAYEQAAGFLRIRDAKNPLDRSAVHPESYNIVEKMARDLNCTVSELVESEELRSGIDLKKYTTETVGMPTLEDIMDELARPGRDPREKFEEFSFAEGIHEVDDLREGMVVPGIVTNVTRFGAFVDIGVHQDGLLHISEMADKFVKDPADVVSLNQKLKVRVKEVDKERSRISLSLKGLKK